MKIAITADLHLREERPERFNTLKRLLQDLLSQDIHDLVIAGDLFDRETTNYGSFDDLVRNFPDIRLHIIPGNHDSGLSQRHFTSPNVRVFSEPGFQEIGPVEFLFLPYRAGRLMDEVLTEVLGQKDRPSRWVLLGHGDYIGSYHEPHPYEKGIYMPLSARAIERHQPHKVILGHIHRPYWQGLGKVHYPGSPCGLDINETGLRGFLVMDLETMEIEPRMLEPEVIYFVETLWVYPVDEETDLLQDSLQEMVNSWKLDREDLAKVVLRLHLRGYAKDKQKVVKIVKEFLSKRGIRLYDKGEPVASQLKSLLEDPYYDESQRLLKGLRPVINALELKDLREGYLLKEEVLGEVLDILYGQR